MPPTYEGIREPSRQAPPRSASGPNVTIPSRVSPTDDNDRRLHAHTSDRVDAMSEEARAELARKLGGRKGGAAPSAATRGPIAIPYRDSGRVSVAEEEEVAAEVARLSADLHRTERRLHQIDRGSTKSRYQMVAGGSPTTRYVRLERRARRIERQLRGLK
jgi:hypothetical protein